MTFTITFSPKHEYESMDLYNIVVIAIILIRLYYIISFHRMKNTNEIDRNQKYKCTNEAFKETIDTVARLSNTNEIKRNQNHECTNEAFKEIIDIITCPPNTNEIDRN